MTCRYRPEGYVATLVGRAIDMLFEGFYGLSLASRPGSARARSEVYWAARDIERAEALLDEALALVEAGRGRRVAP